LFAAFKASDCETLEKFCCPPEILAVAVLVIVNAQVPITGSEYDMLDVLPGLDFVGFGYDARFDAAQTALQVPIMDFSYSQGNQLSCSGIRKFVYKVPDEIFIRNVAFTNADAYLYNSLTEYKSKLALDIGIDMSTLTSQSQTNSTCTTSNGTQPNCTVTGTADAGQLFSLGSTVGFVTESFNSQTSYLVENSEETQLYHIFLDSRYIRPDVKDDLRILANYLFTDNKVLYFKFLEKYGTHYVVSATMGGEVSMMSSIAQTFQSLTNTATASISGGQQNFSSVSQSDALNAANKQFASTLNAQVDFSFSNVNTNIQMQTTSQWRLLGGNSSIVNLLDTRNSSQSIRMWKTTITENPVAVAYRLREISTLFDDPFMRDQLHTAVQVFLTVDTSDTVALNNYTPPPIPGISKRANPVKDLWESVQAKERAEIISE